MTTLKCLHGSTHIPNDPKSFKFELFNYSIDPNNHIDDDNINNGIDGNGPGIYMVPVKNDVSEREADWKFADSYAGTKGIGSVMGVSVNMQNDDDETVQFSTDYPSDHISEHEWHNVIAYMMDERRRLAGYDYDEAVNAIDIIAEQWRDSDTAPDSKALSMLSDALGSLPAGLGDIDDYHSPEEWVKDALGELEVNDPASAIIFEGGPEGIARYAIESSDNLWGTLCKVHRLTAYESTGKGNLTFNKTFNFAVINHVDDTDSVRIAKIDNGAVFVLFDTYEAKLDFIQTQNIKMPDNGINNITAVAKDVLNEYGDDFAPEQLSVKLSEEIRSKVGFELSEECTRLIASSRVPLKKLDDYTVKKISQNIGESVTQQWERSPSMKSLFLPPSMLNEQPNPEPTPERNVTMSVGLR